MMLLMMFNMLLLMILMKYGTLILMYDVFIELHIFSKYVFSARGPVRNLLNFGDKTEVHADVEFNRLFACVCLLPRFRS